MGFAAATFAVNLRLGQDCWSTLVGRCSRHWDSSQLPCRGAGCYVRSVHGSGGTLGRKIVESKRMASKTSFITDHSIEPHFKLAFDFVRRDES